MYYYLGILVLTVFSIGHVQSQCNKTASQKMLDDIKQDMNTVSHVNLYVKMKKDSARYGTNLFDCDDDTKLFDAWKNLQKELLNNIKKSCPDFESSFKEIEDCRLDLAVYKFNLVDISQYCRTFNKCSSMHTKVCAPLKELVLLDDSQSNASVNFCALECDNIPQLRAVLGNCWGYLQTTQKSSSELFKIFSRCVTGATTPTCRITKKMIARIFPLFYENAQEMTFKPVSEKPESKCIQDWNFLKDKDVLTPSMCRTLEGMKTCITKSLKGNDKRYREELAKCQYSVVNLITPEALRQTTDNPTKVSSTAAGKFGSGTYHLAVICWLVTVVTFYFTEII